MKDVYGLGKELLIKIHKRKVTYSLLCSKKEVLEKLEEEILDLKIKISKLDQQIYALSPK